MSLSGPRLSVPWGFPPSQVAQMHAAAFLGDRGFRKLFYFCVLAFTELQRQDGPPAWGPRRACRIRNTHPQSDGRRHKTQILVCRCGSLSMLREICFPLQGPAKKGKKACLWWGHALPSKYGSVFPQCSCGRLNAG